MNALHWNGQSFTDDQTTDSILELDLLPRSGQFDDTLVRTTALASTALSEILRSIAVFQQRLAIAEVHPPDLGQHDHGDHF